MARRIALLLTLASWGCAQAQSAPEPPVTVPALTRVEVKLEEQISSKTNHTGDSFELTINKDVYIGDFLAIPAGSTGEGEVVHAAPAGLGGKPGELILAARFVTVGESRIPLRSLRLNATGKGHFDEALVMTMVGPDLITLDVEPGETYYIRGELSLGLLNPHPNLRPSDKATFESMKAKLRDVTGQYIAAAPQTTEQ